MDLKDLNFQMPRMATNPPLPYGVYKQMADEEKYETLKDIANSAKQIADSAVADSIKAKKKANIATIIYTGGDFSTLSACMVKEL